jgi:hypothetical protein
MDRKQYLFNCFLFLSFAVIQIMSFQCNDKNFLTPNLTVNENNTLLVKNESYIDININENLYLTCEGIEPFEWILPDHTLVNNTINCVQQLKILFKVFFSKLCKMFSISKTTRLLLIPNI